MPATCRPRREAPQLCCESQDNGATIELRQDQVEVKLQTEVKVEVEVKVRREKESTIFPLASTST